mmetsp:Transcript_68368/g.200025  ORF Transcript_68368/g.200025 Transcript_68368/m.200025 type:complete len:470 (+) Transcript_68368:640-2049(+)
MQESHSSATLSKEVQGVAGRLEEPRGAQHYLRVCVLAVAPEVVVEKGREEAEACKSESARRLVLCIDLSLLLCLAHQSLYGVGDPPEGSCQSYDDSAHRKAARMKEEADVETSKDCATLHLLPILLLIRIHHLSARRPPPLYRHNQHLASRTLFNEPSPLTTINVVNALDAYLIHALQVPGLRLLVQPASRLIGLNQFNLCEVPQAHSIGDDEMPTCNDVFNQPHSEQDIKNKDRFPPPVVLEALLQRPHPLVVDDDPCVVYVPHGASKHEPPEGEHKQREKDHTFEERLGQQVKPARARGKDAVTGRVDDPDAFVDLVRGVPGHESQEGATCSKEQPKQHRVCLGLHAVEGLKERIQLLIPALSVPGAEEDPEQKEERQYDEGDGAYAEGHEDQGPRIEPEEVEVQEPQKGCKQGGYQDHGPGIPEAASGSRDAVDPLQGPVDDIVLQRVVCPPLRHAIMALEGFCGV